MHIIGNPQFLKSSFALSILEFARMFYVKSIIIVSRHTDFMIASFVIFFTACKIIKKKCLEFGRIENDVFRSFQWRKLQNECHS